MSWRIIDCFKENNSEKYLILLENNSIIEVGAIIHNSFMRLCFPTQIGCAINCLHCSTTYSDYPFLGNIKYDHMDSMILYFLEKYKHFKDKLILSFSSHGEPSLNWQAVLQIIYKYKDVFCKIFITTIGSKSMFNNILNLNIDYITLYISVHNADDIKRAALIPKKNTDQANLSDIIYFTNKYIKKGGKVVWNYMMYNGNCSIKDANCLLDLLKQIKYKLDVRLTDYINITPKIIPAKKNELDSFVEYINNNRNTNITFRRSIVEGSGIGVACGQMRATKQKDC